MDKSVNLDENLKRKELFPGEVSHTLKRMYEGWREKKKHMENMNQV